MLGDLKQLAYFRNLLALPKLDVGTTQHRDYLFSGIAFLWHLKSFPGYARHGFSHVHWYGSQGEGHSQWNDLLSLRVGYESFGTLNVMDGGSVNPQRKGWNAYGWIIGVLSTGEVTVTGDGSRLNLSGYFYVGSYGTATPFDPE